MTPAGQFPLERHRHRLGPVRHGQLPQDAAHVQLDGPFRDVQDRRDLPVPFAPTMAAGRPAARTYVMKAAMRSGSVLKPVRSPAEGRGLVRGATVEPAGRRSIHELVFGEARSLLATRPGEGEVGRPVPRAPRPLPLAVTPLPSTSSGRHRLLRNAPQLPLVRAPQQEEPANACGEPLWRRLGRPCDVGVDVGTGVGTGVAGERGVGRVRRAGRTQAQALARAWANVAGGRVGWPGVGVDVGKGGGVPAISSIPSTLA